MKHCNAYILLSVALVTTSLHARSSTSLEDCFACPNLFNTDECPCKVRDLELSFKTCLTFDSVISQNIDNFTPVGSIFHRDEADRPGRGPDECHGTFEICFNKELTKAAYRLIILNANKNGRNENEVPVGVFLFNLKVRQTLISVGFTSSPSPFGLCGLTATLGCAPNIFPFPECFCCTGILTDNDLLPSDTIASVYELIRKGELALLVNGSNTCESNKPQYGLLTEDLSLEYGGLLRGQIWACTTGCPVDNTEALNACNSAL